MTQHKWHREIKAWADGDEVEYRLERHDGWSDWKSVDEPFGLTWYKEGAEYRIKPQPKEPQYLYVYGNEAATTVSLEKAEHCNGIPLKAKIKLEQDDETPS